jgi:hypothetical protein
MDDLGPRHVLSEKSIQQQRNVFIWCTETNRLALGKLFSHFSKHCSYQWLGWHVDDHSPITIATAYRWVMSSVQTESPKWKQAKTFVLCPIITQLNGVLLYSVHKNGAALSRESNEIISTGDYGVYASTGQKY